MCHWWRSRSRSIWKQWVVYTISVVRCLRHFLYIIVVVAVLLAPQAARGKTNTHMFRLLGCHGQCLMLLWPVVSLSVAVLVLALASPSLPVSLQTFQGPADPDSGPWPWALTRESRNRSPSNVVCLPLWEARASSRICASGGRSVFPTREHLDILCVSGEVENTEFICVVTASFIGAVSIR